MRRDDHGSNAVVKEYDREMGESASKQHVFLGQACPSLHAHYAIH